MLGLAKSSTQPTEEGGSHEARTCCLAAARRPCRELVGGARGAGAGLSLAADHPDRAVAGGRRRGCALPRGGAPPVRSARQAGRGREPAGRRLGDRDHGGRQGRARRLHLGDGRQRIARHQRHALQEAPLRSGQGLRAASALRQDSVLPRGQSRAAGALGRRAGEIRQGQSRQAVVCVGRRRLSRIISMPNCSRA